MSGSYTQTPNLGLYKPTPNSDTGTWGIHLNSNADVLDAALGTGAGAVFLPLTGGTLTSSLGTTSSAAALTVNSTAGGSGTNGPLTAQFGLNINHQKANWNATSGVAVGEIDGLQIFCRQGGAGSDCGGYLVNVQNTGLGFLAMCEMVSSVLNLSTQTITKMIDVTLGALDGPTNSAYGMTITAINGTLDHGILIQDTPAQATWTSALSVTRNSAQVFNLGGDGSITTSGSVTSNGPLCAGAGEIFLRGDNAIGLHWNGSNNRFEFDIAGTAVAAVDNSGTFWANGAIHADPLYLRSDTGVNINYDGATGGIQFYIGYNVAEFLGSGALAIAGTKVVGTQIAGWGTPTGGSRIANFPGATATAAQTAQALAQLILDLKTHGLIGA